MAKPKGESALLRAWRESYGLDSFTRNKNSKFFNFVAAYTALSAVALLAFLTFSQNPPLKTSFERKLEKDNFELTRRVSDLEKLKDVNPQILSEKSLQVKLDSLANQQQAISDTILGDTDQALTAKLLREKQKDLENDVQDLRLTNQRLEGNFITLLLSVIGVPVVGVVLTLLGNWIVARFFRNSDSKSG